MLASSDDSDALGNLQSFAPSVADNGTVAFTSFANNLVGPGKTSQFQNVFVRKTPSTNGTTDIVSVGPADAPGGGPSKEPSISADGNMVAFTSAANNIGDGTEDANGEDDVFVRDVAAKTTKRITADLKAFQPAIRADGDQVAYSAEFGDSDIRKDIFLQSTSAGANGGSLVSGCTPCSDITDRPAVVPSIADDGKVTFQSAARYEAPSAATRCGSPAAPWPSARATPPVPRPISPTTSPSSPRSAATATSWPSRRPPPTWSRTTSTAPRTCS